MDEDRIAAILEKFSHLAEEDSVTIFTREEAAILQRFSKEVDIDTLQSMINIYSSLRGAMAVGGWLGSFLKWFVVIVAGIAAVKVGLLEWLTSGGGK